MAPINGERKSSQKAKTDLSDFFSSIRQQIAYLSVPEESTSAMEKISELKRKALRLSCM
jgi:hypothetical protein